jgi:citrate synthase
MARRRRQSQSAEQGEAVSARGPLLTAREAAVELGVKPETIYAYVSRGLLHSQAGPDSRSRLYPRDEVEGLKLRRAGRRDPAAVSREALSWGLPVLESAITLIRDGSLYYRGLEVGGLARTLDFERVASLLWHGDPARAAELFPVRSMELPAAWRRVVASLRDRHPGERLQVVLRYAASEDAAAMDLRPEGLAAWGARLLALLVASVCGRRHHPGEGLLAPLYEAWMPGVAGAARLLDGALILCADHELNVSSFTARCVASAGSNPYEAVAAALGALRGFRHGGHSDRVEDLLTQLGVHRLNDGPPPRQEIRRVVEERLQRGERIPGFGQPLYPDGDPRCRVLLDLIEQAYPGSVTVAAARAVAAEVEALISQRATIDLALATLSLELALGPGGAFTIFALGRTAGWVGHVMEEYQRGRLIRPRARYVGPPPGAAELAA